MNQTAQHEPEEHDSELIEATVPEHLAGKRFDQALAEMFPEFQFLGILIGIFIAVGLVTAFTGARRWLVFFTGMAFVYGAAALSKLSVCTACAWR